MEKSNLVDFGRIDQTADPRYFIRFLDEAAMQESFQAYKRRTFELLDVRLGQRLLEVGCGTGDDARGLCRLVGRNGKVVAIDNSKAMINEAARRAEGRFQSLQLNVADAMQLQFPDASFDACRADRSFMHIPDPAQALREMVRVTRPGGRVLVYEVDFETLVIDAPDHDLARRIVNAWCDSFPNGWLGRHMPALFRECGLADPLVVPATLMLTYNLAASLIGAETVARAQSAGKISADEGRTWLKFLEEAHYTGRFFSSLLGYIVWAKKP
jgi:ubiquinone/menaquinone biosynthesis C-methylase UbiE